MRLIFLGLLALCCISSALTTTSEGKKEINYYLLAILQIKSRALSFAQIKYY